MVSLIIVERGEHREALSLEDVGGNRLKLLEPPVGMEAVTEIITSNHSNNIIPSFLLFEWLSLLAAGSAAERR